MKATSTSPKAKDKLLRLGAVLFWLLIWQLGSMAVDQEILLVSPVSACATLIRLMGESSFYQAVFGSFGRILAGFALSTVLGILLAGCAYVPFLRTNPVKRISYMMQTAGVKIALCGKTALAKLAQEDLPCRCVALDSGAGAPYLPCETGGEDLMYVLYTSGSTGQPKGVMLRHRALSNLLGGMKEWMAGLDGPILCTTNVVFDTFITESLLPLAMGIPVVLADDEQMLLPWETAHTHKAKTRRHLICAVTGAPFSWVEVSSPYCPFHPISLLLRKETGWSPKETRLWVPPRGLLGPARLSHGLEAPTSQPTASS